MHSGAYACYKVGLIIRSTRKVVLITTSDILCVCTVAKTRRGCMGVQSHLHPRLLYSLDQQKKKGEVNLM